MVDSKEKTMNMRDEDGYNEYGERLEYNGDITLNLDYWDCECDTSYIHPISEEKCIMCGSLKEDSPSSREIEVQKLYHKFDYD